MGHTHPVIDRDTNHFIIDPSTRSIKYGAAGTNASPPTLVKGDHNSEIVTFEVPKSIEGHDMIYCDQIEIHYINIEQETRRTNPNVYLVNMDDVSVTTDKLNFKWLLSSNTTKYAGSISFAVRFVCHAVEKDDNGEDYYTDEVVYAWNTSPYSSIAVSDGISNNIEDIPNVGDVIQEWWNKIADISEDSFYAITDDGLIIDICDSIETNTTNIAKLSSSLTTIIEDRIANAKNIANLASAVDATATTDEETGEITYTWTVDTTLQDNIDAEATARETADTTLQTNYENISYAVMKLASAVKASSGLDDEGKITYTWNADTTLQNNIDAEATTRASAIANLAEAVGATATTDEETGEITYTWNADTTLQNNIDAEATTRASAIANLAEAVGATATTDEETGEITYTWNADTTLQNNIDAVAEDLSTLEDRLGVTNEYGGFQGGTDAQSSSGAAVGYQAYATSGAAIGASARSEADGAVQLGTGTNIKEGTLQFRDYQLLDADGIIPNDRLPDDNSGNFKTSNEFKMIDVNSKDGTRLSQGTHEFVIVHGTNRYTAIITVHSKFLIAGDNIRTLIAVVMENLGGSYALYMYYLEITEDYLVYFYKYTDGAVVPTVETATVWHRQII